MKWRDFIFGRKPSPQEEAGLVESDDEHEAVLPPSPEFARTILEEEKYPEWLLDVLNAWFARDVKLSNLPGNIAEYLYWISEYAAVELEEYLLSKIGGPRDYITLDAYRDAIERALINVENFRVAATAIIHRGLNGFERRLLAGRWG